MSRDENIAIETRNRAISNLHNQLDEIESERDALKAEVDRLKGELSGEECDSEYWRDRSTQAAARKRDEILAWFDEQARALDSIPDISASRAIQNLVSQLRSEADLA